MSYLVDGSNLLGKDRESDPAKRDLVRLLASFARSRNTSVSCFFDGTRPAGFALSLGRLTVEFTHPLSADERIVAVASRRSGGIVRVVTSDRGLADRIRGRRVQIVGVAEFRALLEQASGETGAIEGEDWERYFSDPKNRNVF